MTTAHHLRWLSDGKEHRFECDAGGTLSVDGGLWLNLSELPVASGDLSGAVEIELVADEWDALVTVTAGPETLDSDVRWAGHVTHASVRAPTPPSRKRRQPTGSRPPSEEPAIQCEWCGRERPASQVGFVADPFREEVHGEIEESWMCQDCYAERQMEV